MSETPIVLLPFDQNEYRKAVSKSLFNIGYKVKIIDEPINGDSWADEVKGILVFLFGRHFPKNAVLSLLAKLNNQPRLCIFIRDCVDWDEDILDYCNEFSSWPCLATELAFRLERLSSRYSKPVRNPLSDDLSSELIRINMRGVSPQFRQVIARIKKFSRCDAPVLIEGETGTGKELAARAIHYFSDRKGYPFIPVNCGALPDNLIENELFGHEQGAYTDARSSYNGLVSQAKRGTLFLDEIEALSPKAQVTILRFLQEYEYRPLGSNQAAKAEVRIIAASNTSLSELILTGKFRSDLMFRLNVMPLVMPPLRQRIEDIELLCEHFTEIYRIKYNQPNKRLEASTMQYLKEYDWPGNIRELENFVHREFLMADGDVICSLGLEAVRAGTGAQSSTYTPRCLSGLSFSQAKACVIEEFEKDYLTRLIAEANGNVTCAAKRAGKERRAFGKLLKKHAIKRSEYA